LEYGVDEILVASGGRPLIYALFRAVCDKNDKIIYAVPSWNNNHYTHFVEGEHVIIEAKAENNFMPTAADIVPHIQSATFLSLCSPQNPTGTTFRREDLLAICDMVVAENKRRGEEEKKLYVMFDQMYWQLTYGDIEHYNPVKLNSEMRPYTIFIDAVSKVFGCYWRTCGMELRSCRNPEQDESHPFPCRRMGPNGRAESIGELFTTNRSDKGLSATFQNRGGRAVETHL
jgi:aspartate aminotransferase